MRLLRIFFLVLAVLVSPMAKAQEVVVGLSDNEIGIDAFFDGSDLFVYGAIRPTADALISFEDPYDVIITIASPREPVTVRRKERRFGIWMNVDAVKVDLAPTVYAIATSAPLADALENTEDLRHSVSIPRMIRSVGAPMDVADADAFAQAVQRIRQAKGLYQTFENAVELRANTLFSTSIPLPANLTEGDYALRVLITRGGAVVAKHDSMIPVQKVGAERWLYELAHNQPLYYGLLSLAIAIFAGWGASAVFQLVRR
ncbi:MAG: TIGR02186 family protein [Pseudomonadota bacterium]